MELRWGKTTSVDVVVRMRRLRGSVGFGVLCDVSTTGGLLQTRLDLPLPYTLQIERLGNGPRPGMTGGSDPGLRA
jgi:hypothetical protein